MKLVKIVLFMMLVLSAVKLYASNVSFLNYSAMYYFTEKDSTLMMANINKALNSVGDGRKSSWQNPKTGASGYAIPSHTRKQNGVVCRDVKVFNMANHVPGESNYTFCKMQGKWRINMGGN